MNTPAYRMEQPFRLVMQTGPTPGEVFMLSELEVTIGRESSNAITIIDPEISRQHARLIQQGGSYLFIDLGSTNGSYINGQRLIGPHLLKPGERITLGENVTLVFEVLQAPSQVDPDATLLTPTDTQPGTPARVRQVSGAPQPGIPGGQQVRNLPPAPPPIYAESSQQPVEAYPSTPEEEPRRGIDVRWLAAGCGCLSIVSCAALAGFFFWVDAGGVARWCQFFGFIFPACP
jgi:pSer/pThr/pTyr-binding forkhead associated (FHA) protein